jgi:prepilin-type N-terminal cleavage/methylation domain-containing protein/prepilin-type processing-associated H-X9-DG protein
MKIGDSTPLLQQHNSTQSQRAFTLVELLVVIGIIAIIIALLLPLLGRTRRSANTVICASNLRSILQGMLLYTAQYKDAIPGSPNTTGAFLLSPAYSQNYAPEISQIWDYQAPIARVIRQRFETGGTIAQRISRFTQLLSIPLFHCPENDIIATPYTEDGGPNFSATPWISYTLAAPFLYLNSNYRGTVGIELARPEYDPTPDYSPKLNRIGNPARKIYIADGGRFTTTSAPTMNLNYVGTFGGAYADVGPWSSFSRAWDRGKAPGNGREGDLDPRIFSYRHGMRSAGGPADSFRFNAGFYDGHVETLGDLEGANPHLWVPRGTRVPANEAYPDVAKKYFSGHPDPLLVQ